MVVTNQVGCFSVFLVLLTLVEASKIETPFVKLSADVLILYFVLPVEKEVRCGGRVPVVIGNKCFRVFEKGSRIFLHHIIINTVIIITIALKFEFGSAFLAQSLLFELVVSHRSYTGLSGMLATQD